MQFEQFVGQVQHRAHLATQGAAVRAICATLETLGERISWREANDLAAQLPAGIGAYLRLAREQERFDVHEFYRRIAEREGPGVDTPKAVFHARVVITLLEEAVSFGEIKDILDQLPADYIPLFAAGSEGAMRM